MKKVFFIIGLYFVGVTLYGLNIFRREKQANNPTYEIIEVEVEGAVKFPGTYQVSEGTRLWQLIKYAGGMLNEADNQGVNLDGFVEKYAYYYIPFLTVTEQIITTDKININTADVTLLMRLTGIGSQKAEAIVLYRSKNGLFKEIEELKNVSGIGEKIYEQIKDYITV